MPSLTSKTVVVWGVICLLRSITYILLPTTILNHFALPLSASAMSNEAGQRGVTTGVLYIMGGLQDNKPLAMATVPLRLLGAAIFWLQSGHDAGVFVQSNASNWRVASAWEGVGALATALALVWDVYGERLGRIQKRGEKEE